MRKVVLAMASGGKPIKRILTEVGERVFYLANPDRIAAVEAGETNPVGFPQEDVFEFDEVLFSKLCTEWQSKGRTSPELWSAAKRFGS